MTADRIAQLIELGRDREAAELASASDTDEGAPMDVLSQFQALGPALGGVVAGIRPDQLANPTPCAEFTVQGVIDHMIGGATMFAAAFRGEAPPEPGTDFGAALGDLVAAVSAPGALGRTVAAPFGEVPGETFARFIVLDGLVHGWDMATATGQAYEPADALVAEVAAFAEGALAPLRDGVTFAEPTTPPAGATPIQRLAAFTGRRV